MNDGLWKRARDIFEQVMDMDESRQMVFVKQACGADQRLMAEVKRMIEADRRHYSLLDQPIFHWREIPDTTLDKNPGRLPFDYIGNYKLIRRLGEGGMGEVYLAVEEPVNRKVAIKLMRAGLDANFLRRFNDERKALASLNQRSIVMMFASGEANNRPYFVMEYLEGESLRERMRRGPIPLPEIAEITGQICDALNTAHNRGIVHRDVKPENIFLSHDDDGLLVKVLDFGIATLKKSEARTTTNLIVGTAAYFSPEQARGLNRKEIDGRADIYTLGVVVYEMLTGARPFTATTTAGYQHLHLNVTPDPPSKRASGAATAEAVSDVVMKALAKDPAERHQTAREFARELKKAVEKPIPSPAPRLTEPLPPRRKAFPSRQVLLAAVAILVLGAGGWLATSQFRQSSGGGQSNPPDLPETTASSGATPSAPALAPELNVELAQKGKGVVPPETIFRSGDRVRLTASPNQSGHFYIVMRGTVGPAEILYPDSRIKGSYAAVQANQRIEMPPSRSQFPWFMFDNEPGVETLYIVLATRKSDERLQSLESAVQQKRSRLNAAQELQIVAALEALAGGQSTSANVTVKKIQLRHEK